MKILFTLIYFSFSAAFAFDEKELITKKVKQRKNELKLFQEKVSSGDKCKLRDYSCFKNQILLLRKGQSEDLSLARSILEPFFLRSLKANDLPCTGACFQNLLAYHIDTFLLFVTPYYSKGSKDLRISAYPTIDSTRIRGVLELNGIDATSRNSIYLKELVSMLKPKEITAKDVLSSAKINGIINWMNSDPHLSNSVLCHLHPGDIVFDEMMNDEKIGPQMREFNNRKNKSCKDTTPLDYRGIDDSTKKHYANIRDAKLSKIDECPHGDLGCMRRHLRGIGIRYSEDLKLVHDRMKAFAEKSKPSDCNETCQSQFLISILQTWITYFSTFERSHLASTLDWKIYPEAKFDTIPEDINFLKQTKEIFTQMMIEFAKIDPGSVKDEGLKSEIRSVGKDLSDLASGKIYKDSVICSMEPWSATFDKYLSPFKDKKKDEIFEAEFLEFKSTVCK